METLRILTPVLAASLLAIVPASAQPPDCDQTLVPSMGFATADMSSAIDPAVAMTHQDKLIFAKSYGFQDAASAVFTESDTRFRVASVSKAITAMGIMRLVHVDFSPQFAGAYSGWMNQKLARLWELHVDGRAGFDCPRRKGSAFAQDLHPQFAARSAIVMSNTAPKA